MGGPEYFARYPFLRESSSYIRGKGPTLEKLLSGGEYARVRSRGRERVRDALENQEIKPGSTATRAECLIEILSYPLARIIVSAVNDTFLTRRYALAEAERAHILLQGETPGTVLDISKELGLDAAEDEPVRLMRNSQALQGIRFRVNFVDYLRYSSAMRGGTRGAWKLVNQELEKGHVHLPADKFLRIVQQAVQQKIESELPLELEKAIRDGFRDDVRELREKLENHKKKFRTDDVGKLSVVNLPPCMRRLLSMAQAGENIPHQGRFALTTFLHTLGMSADDIIKLFSLSPDFDVKKSRYQVEHITGVISSTEYTPPECSTMKTYGICFEPDSLCGREWMTHPLKYYRTKTGRRMRTAPGNGKGDSVEGKDGGVVEKENPRKGNENK
jgi:DNA primase large subunit